MFPPGWSRRADKINSTDDRVTPDKKGGLTSQVRVYQAKPEIDVKSLSQEIGIDRLASYAYRGEMIKSLSCSSTKTFLECARGWKSEQDISRALLFACQQPPVPDPPYGVVLRRTRR